MSENANESKAVATVSEQIDALATGGDFFSTIKGTDQASKRASLAAMMNSEPISEHFGETIQLRHFVVQRVQVADDNTGELTDQPRVILIAEDGTAYHAVSSGLMSSLRNIIGALGEPDTWESPLPVQIVEEKSRKGYRFMTVKLA